MKCIRFKSCCYVLCTLVFGFSLLVLVAVTLSIVVHCHSYSHAPLHGITIYYYHLLLLFGAWRMTSSCSYPTYTICCFVSPNIYCYDLLCSTNTRFVCFFHLSSSIFIPTLTLTIPYGKSIRCKKQWPWHHHWHNVLFPCTYELFFHPSTRTRVLILHRDYSTEYSYPVHYIALDACKKVSGVLVTILTVVSIPINTLHPELTFATRNLCCCVLAFFLSLLQVCQDININNVHAGDTYWGRQVLTITPT